MEFEFDPDKSAASKEKHGIEFVEAQEIWADNRALDLAAMSSGEPRSFAIGLIEKRH